MMEDVLKACASYQSTSTSPASVKLSSQAVGFLSVLAISGSVALIALGRQKLWQYVFETPTNASAFFPSSGSGDLASTAHRKIAAQFLCAEGEALESRGSDDCRLMLRCAKTTTVVQKRKRSTLKKVRFAPEVVDPAGDGRDYRRRMKETYRKQRQPEVQQQFKKNSSNAPQSTKEGKIQQRSSLPMNRIILYEGIIRQNRLQQAVHWP